MLETSGKEFQESFWISLAFTDFRKVNSCCADFSTVVPPKWMFLILD